MNRDQFVDRITRERMARLINELVEKNQREMSKKSRHDAEGVLKHWNERWPEYDWKEVFFRQCRQQGRLGKE